MPNSPKILLTGATGYVGGRLLTRLQERSMPVRCLVRRPGCLSQRVGETTEIVVGDVLDPDSLAKAFENIQIAYYLVHSMGSSGDFAEQDRLAAENFSKAAKAAGVQRIIYLGGLGNPDHNLSKHLASRQETGDRLRLHHPHVIEFRASIVIGSGSLSFEMIRSLVERLPIMICPKWVEVKAQPIAIEDLLAYLLAAIDLPNANSQVFEVGGPDRVSYGEIMREYARQRGLRRYLIPVPLLTPYLSSLWLGLVTPLYARVGRKLVDSMRNATLLSNNLALRSFPIEPRPMHEALRRALSHEDQELAETRWSDALSSAGEFKQWAGKRFGSRLIDSRTVNVSSSSEQAFAPIRRIGGKTGWYYGSWLWSLRGSIDLICGGVGIRRGRRDPEHVRVGDTLDFWRIEAFEPNQRLRLRAEMKVPGRAWLEFEVSPHGSGSQIRQTAIFDPVGLMGLVYWYGIYPIHKLVFAGMLRNIARIAEQRDNNMLYFRKETRIAAPPDAVFRFHQSPDALKKLIPPWEKVQVIESSSSSPSSSLEVGSRVVLQGKVGPLRLRWVALHTECRPPHLFVDRQEAGPFAVWIHRHEFLPDGQGGTVLRDDVQYKLPLGWFGRWVAGRWIRRRLQAMFDYRHKLTTAKLQLQADDVAD